MNFCENFDDSGLEIIDEMSHEELLELVYILIAEPGVVESFKNFDEYIISPDCPEKYRRIVKYELLSLGSPNKEGDFATYKDILLRVCELLNVEVDNNYSIPEKEHKLLSEMIKSVYEELPEEEKKKFQKVFGKDCFDIEILTSDVLKGILQKHEAGFDEQSKALFKYLSSSFNALRKDPLHTAMDMGWNLWRRRKGDQESSIFEPLKGLCLSSIAIIPAILNISMVRELHQIYKQNTL